MSTVEGEARLHAVLGRLPSATASDGRIADLVAGVIEDIRRAGDDAIVLVDWLGLGRRVECLTRGEAVLSACSVAYSMAYL